MTLLGGHLPQVDFIQVDRWAWNEIKALSVSWFVRLALVLCQIKYEGRWPQDILDAHIAMTPRLKGIRNHFAFTCRLPFLGNSSAIPHSGRVLCLGA